MKTIDSSSWREMRRLFGLPLGATLLILSASLSGVRAQTSSSGAPGQTQSTQTNMKQFVMLFRQGPKKLSDAELARRQREISAWARAQNEAGHKLDPHILTPEVARPHGDEGVGREAWPITALLFFEARDLAEAAEIAGSHPAKDYNVTVEVRAWAPPLVPAGATAEADSAARR